MGFGFRSRTDAEGLLRLLNGGGPRVLGVRNPTQGGSQYNEQLTYGFVFKTPASGIEARVGMRPGKAPCVAYYIDNAGNLETLQSRSGGDQEYDVYNIFGSPIAGDAWITAKLLYQKLIVDAEDCAAGGAISPPATATAGYARTDAYGDGLTI